MSAPSADRPGSPDPGTERMPLLGARVAEPAPSDHGHRAGPDDTGPVAIVGSRPAPPPAGGAGTEPPTTALPEAAPPPLPLPAADPRLPFGASSLSGEGSPPAQSDKPPGRAGRNLRAALGVGLGLGAVLLASLLIWRPAFLAVLGAAILVAVVELTRALAKGGFRAPLVPLLIGTVAMEALAWTRGPTGLVVGFLATALAVLLWRLGDGPAGYLRDASAGVLVALYVPLLAGFAVLLLVPEDGALRVVLFVATVVCSDVGGYAAGVLFGRHPMAPSISPKKSWEGMAGSVLACILFATPMIALALDGPWWGGLVFGAALAATATTGDLAESLIKRDLGIKDMGDLLPGHGGIMDRLDSLLPSAAVSYLLLAVLAPM
jgi:phosphatidate cytidylyltransferase